MNCALSRARAQKSRAFLLTLTYIDARDPGTIPRGTPLTGRYRQTQFRLSTFLLANSLQRLSERQFVAIRIEHVEIAFTP